MIDMLAKLSKIQKETVWSAITKGISLLLLIPIYAILARRMGVESYGQWSYFLAAFNIIFLLSILGVDSSVRINIAKYHEDGLLRPILRSGVLLRLFITLSFCCLLVVSAQPLADILKRPDFGPLFRVSVALLIAQGMVEFLKEVFQGLHRIKYNFIINFIEYGTKLLLVLLLLSVGSHYEQVIIIYSVGALVASCIGGWILYSTFYKPSPVIQAPEMFSNIFRYSFPMFIISVAGMISLEMNTILLGYLSDDTQVGIYAPAKEVSFKMQHLAAVLGIGVLPVFANQSVKQIPYLKQLLKKVMSTILLAYGFVGLIIMVYSDWFIPLIFGEQFQASATVLKLLFPFNLFAGVTMILAGILDYRGMANKRALFLVVTMTINLFLSWLLIPAFGANGVALATGFAYFFYLSLSWFQVRKMLRFDRNQAKIA